ncbi:MAG: amidohydrolase family protein, partial [Candidatus Bathyarchaeota archaeon]
MNYTKNRADIVILNGKIITVDPMNSISEAVAIKDTIILKVGTRKEIEKLIDKDTHIIDVKGRAVLPGFIDSHIHFQLLAINLKYREPIHVPPLNSLKDVFKLLKKRAKETPQGEWIVGWGSFHLNHKYREKRYPTKLELDEVLPDHPAALFSGPHICIVNSKALLQAGITKETPEHVKLPGRMALIEKDSATGEPIGIIREAGELLPLPKFTYEQIEDALRDIMMRDFVQQGVTSIHDMPGLEVFRIYQKWTKNNELPLRIRVYFYMPK